MTTPTNLLIVVSSQVLRDTEQGIESGTTTANIVSWVIHGEQHSAGTQQSFALPNQQLCIYKCTEAQLYIEIHRAAAVEFYSRLLDLSFDVPVYYF